MRSRAREAHARAEEEKRSTRAGVGRGAGQGVFRWRAGMGGRAEGGRRGDGRGSRPSREEGGGVRRGFRY